VGDAALLVDDPDDAQALADALQRVLTDETVRNHLIARGHTRHHAFSWTQAVDELLDVYAAVRA
jgi:glycosyltransferase involved in cell wall biosynthesis